MSVSYTHLDVYKRQEQDHTMATGINGYRTLWQLAGKFERLELVSLALLGHAIAYMA